MRTVSMYFILVVALRNRNCVTNILCTHVPLEQAGFRSVTFEPLHTIHAHARHRGTCSDKSSWNPIRRVYRIVHRYCQTQIVPPQDGDTTTPPTGLCGCCNEMSPILSIMSQSVAHARALFLPCPSPRVPRAASASQTLASAQEDVRAREDQIAKLQARLSELEGQTPAAAPAVASTGGNATAADAPAPTPAPAQAQAPAPAPAGGVAARATRPVSPTPPAQQQQQQQRGLSPTLAGRSAAVAGAEGGAAAGAGAGAGAGAVGGADDGGEASLRNRLMARSESCGVSAVDSTLPGFVWFRGRVARRCLGSGRGRSSACRGARKGCCSASQARQRLRPCGFFFDVGRSHVDSPPAPPP